MTSTNPQPDDFERFGRYAIIRPIRKGGMAQLALAYDMDGARPVVLKRLPPDSESKQDRFRDELKLSRSLGEHPNLVRALDSGTAEGRDFLALEWIAGPDLERLLEVAIGGKLNLPLPIPVIGSITWQVLKGLAHLHANGALHRDISVGNVMVGYDGLVRIIDLGIAKFDGKRHRTVVGDIPGTQGFIAPELDGTKEATERSDLYGVGACLWFLLTGLRFFDAGVDNEGKELLSLRLKERGRDDVPAGMLTLLWRLLHKSPAARYDSANEAAAVLEANVPVASDTEVASYVGKLFAAEKDLAAENVADWKVRFARPRSQLTAVMRSVSSTDSAPRDEKRRSTTVIDRVGRGQRKTLIVTGIAIGVAIAAAILFFTIPRRTTPVVVVAQPQHVATPAPPVVTPPPPVAPVVTPLPVEPEPVVAPAVTKPSHPTTHIAKLPVETPPAHPSDAARQKLKEASDLAGMGRTKLAKQIYGELEEDPGARPQALVGLARLAYGDGDYDGAVRIATDAAKGGGGPDALMVRASAYLARRESDKAEADFDRVLTMQPKNLDAAEGRKAAAQLKKESP